MSWSELERFVDDVEADGALQRALKHCRSRKELILAARRLGYRITRIDLQRAWEEEHREHAREAHNCHQRASWSLGHH
jgi:predicted ribosomally synthesized peptide with nif11-like leader